MPSGRRWADRLRRLPTGPRRRFHRAVASGHSGIAGSPVIIMPTRADGTTIEAEMTIGLITDDAGAVAGVIVSLRPAGPWRRIESYAPGDRNPTSR